jgi:glutathione S-transferase
MMTLHWSPRSPFVRKVMIAVYEMGLEARIDRIRTVVAPTKVAEALLPDNPLSKLPTLVLEDGSSLFDSRVILEHLDGLHSGPRLFPASGPERWIALRNQALGDGVMDFALLWLIERQRGEGLQSEPLITAFRAKLAASLARMDRDVGLLANRPFDIGHLTLGTALGYLDFRFPTENWRSGHSDLAAWHATFLQRPSVLANPVVDDS